MKSHIITSISALDLELLVAKLGERAGETIKAAVDKVVLKGAENPCELVISSFLEAAKGYCPSRGVSFPSFASRVLWRRTQDEIRGRFREKRSRFMDEVRTEVCTCSSALSQHQRDALACALLSIDKASRRLIYLRFWKKLSFKDISGLPEYSKLQPAALRQKISRIYAQLRDLISKTTNAH